LGPASYGVFKIFSVYSQYFKYTSLGLSSTINRNLPIEIGRGNEFEQAQLVNTTLTVVMFTTGLACGALLVAYWTGWKPSAIPNTTYYSFLGLWLIAMALSSPLQGILTCRTAFVLIGKTEIVLVVMDLGLAIFLGWRWGLPGVLIATLMTSYLRLAIYWRALRLTWHFSLPWKRLLGYWQIGLPITANGFLNTLIRTAGALAVALHCSPWWLGQYGFAMTIVAAAEMLPMQLNTVLSQHMSQQYGRSPNDLPQLRSMVDRPTVFVSLITILMIAILPVAASVMVTAVMPQYAESLRVIPWLLLALYYHLLYSFSGHLLNLIRKQVVYAAINAASLLIMWVGFGSVSNSSAVPMAIVFAIGGFVNGASLLIASLWLLRSDWRFVVTYMTRLLILPLPILLIGNWLTAQVGVSLISTILAVTGSFFLAAMALGLCILIFPEYELWGFIYARGLAALRVVRGWSAG
jgi:O-antigen/teichoic acid export membrane protein